ncbi:MAG: RagB/SusD family nutrient uptake outer membrane protein [Psychroserpens sp.]|uniref:RagB/SusD family nutrient uptake outer membrane protein n=1 Tax=Psychroserpens sp. TaxID=2020870 RepID=UPI003C78B35D
MKKYLLILTLTITTLFIGCSDSLDRSPVDQLIEDTAFKTVRDLEFGLAGAIGNYGGNINDLVAFNSIFTDNCALGVDNGGQELPTLQQILNADTGDRGLWIGSYSTINDFNRLIASAENITPLPAETNTYDNVLAQAYAFRALLHYDVLLYYGFDITDASATGVPYIDFVAVDGLAVRNTTGEVLAEIQEDLDLSLSLLPAGTSDINFVTPDFITFLRARIALETGDYNGAIAFATTIIDSYPLATSEQYFDMFNEDANTTEVIWKYDSVQGFNLGLGGTWNFIGPGPFIEMSNELEDLFTETDIRRAVNVEPTSLISDDPAENIAIVGKYPQNADELGINDFKAMRVSEAYLIRAEAHARLSQFSQASDDVFEVRVARDFLATQTPYLNINEAIAGVIAERRLELAYEGHRYNDIKRVRDILNVGIIRDESDCGGAVPCVLPVNDQKWIFPVPTLQINANPDIGQAPGY